MATCPVISNDEIKFNCNPRSLARARQLAAASQKNIFTRKVRNDGEESVLSAFVASSSGWADRYRTSVTVDEAREIIVDYSCTCPAYLQYDGMCKHCAALALTYNKEPHTFAGYREYHAPATSSCLSDFMQRAELAALTLDGGMSGSGMLEANGLVDNAMDAANGILPPKSIDIETTLVRAYHSWSAHFKIAAPQASYSIKNISEFVERMQQGTYFSYGKKLAFAHFPELLTKRARTIERFLARAVALREQTSAAAYWRYRNADVVGRDLELSEIELIELLDLLADHPFTVEDADLPKKTSAAARILNENPHLPLAIRAHEQGGYLVARNGSADVVVQGERAYLRQDATFFRCTPEFSACAEFLRTIYENGDERLFVSQEDMPLFCTTVLPLIKKHLDISAPPEVESFSPTPCKLEFYLDKNDDFIVCDAWAVYGTQHYCLCGTGNVPSKAENKPTGGSTENAEEDAGNAHDGNNHATSGKAGEEPGASTKHRETATRNESERSAQERAAGTPRTLEPMRNRRREECALSLVGRYFNVTSLTDGAPAPSTKESARAKDAKRTGAKRNAGNADRASLSATNTHAVASTNINNAAGGHASSASAALISLDDDNAATSFLFGGLAEFRLAGDVFTTPAFDRLISDRKPSVTLGVSLAGDLINLEVSADDLPAGELAALLGSYRKHKRYHKLKSGAYLDLQDFDLAQLDRLAADLDITAKQLATGRVELPAYRAFLLDEEANLARDRSFERYLERFRSTSESDYETPASLEQVLRPYQAEGFRWLSARCDANFGGILADEMGLGKSVQLISLLLARKSEARGIGPSLVACPASLVYNWLAEFERFAPELSVVAISGTKQERSRARLQAFAGTPASMATSAATNMPATTNGAPPAPAPATNGAEADATSTPAAAAAETRVDVLVTSYDSLRIDIADYTGREFFCFALDEAQYIKNPGTLVARATKRIEARHRFALTGTPMENRLSDLWSIFDFLMPGLLGPYARFRDRFEEPIVGGNDACAKRLQAATRPFMLRRLKEDVLTDLPEKLESVVYVEMGGEQKRLYAAHEQRLREDLTEQHNARNEHASPETEKSKVEILAELTKLRQLCCDPGLLYENYVGNAVKLDAIVELLQDARDAGEKTLVFSQFTSFLSRIADRLDACRMPYFTITGATPKKQRLRLVNAFNENDTPVFLISLKAGGTGLNLTGASVVIHADPWWNEAAQNQATDRAHRIGQTHVVSVQKIIAKGTIEERILKLQQAKRELAGQVVGAGNVSLSSLTSEDLLRVLGDE